MCRLVSFSVVFLVCLYCPCPTTLVFKHSQNTSKFILIDTGFHVYFFLIFRFVQQCMTPWCSDRVARPQRHRSLLRPVLPTMRAPPGLRLPRAAGSLRRRLPRPAGATAGSLRPSLPRAAGAAGILRRSLPGAAAGGGGGATAQVPRRRCRWHPAGPRPRVPNLSWLS